MAGSSRAEKVKGRSAFDESALEVSHIKEGAFPLQPKVWVCIYSAILVYIQIHMYGNPQSTGPAYRNLRTAVHTEKYFPNLMKSN